MKKKIPLGSHGTKATYLTVPYYIISYHSIIVFTSNTVHIRRFYERIAFHRSIGFKPTWENDWPLSMRAATEKIRKKFSHKYSIVLVYQVIIKFISNFSNKITFFPFVFSIEERKIKLWRFRLLRFYCSSR